MSSSKGERHILSLSGGKDSSALAIYMKNRVPAMEYVFCDTEKELPETYEYLGKLEAFLGQPIRRLKHEEGLGFDALLTIRRGYLPSPQARWCTDYLKIKPFEKYVGDDIVTSYVGIRADEPHRRGYISTKPNIKARFPFVEDNIRKQDVLRILQESGLGIPSYYQWRSRSGCYFCFFQQRREWVGLLETHPELYQASLGYEKTDPVTGERYTWIQNESLADLAKPDRIERIKEQYQRRLERERSVSPNSSLSDVFGDETDSGSGGCLVCHL
ncbi:MAG: phosphoadenosine phosphosulfate reductase family protein [Planctomycetaceae bacterium]|nr:phosphoadenosine phosphosulfate reductase family protein [Planctomycetaceae bacterium]